MARTTAGASAGQAGLSAGLAARTRMTGSQRREQLIEVARALFAEKGYAAASVEEVAHRGGVSKPVVYEHFGGKEGLYTVVVDRDMGELLGRITDALAVVGPAHPRDLLTGAAAAFLGYIEDNAGGFQVLVRDSPVAGPGTFSSLLGDIAGRVEEVLAREFVRFGVVDAPAALYSQALVGMVAQTGQWWLETRRPPRDEVAAHLVNMAWHGLSGIDRIGGSPTG